MNIKLMKSILMCCMVICGNVTNATEDSLELYHQKSNLSIASKETNMCNEDNEKTNMCKENNDNNILNNKQRKLLSACCLKMVLNNTPRVEYDPSEMWFDYQALFDKTKLAILGVDNDIDVCHTYFSKDNIAGKSLFGNEENYEETLSKILDGDINTQKIITSRLLLAYNSCNKQILCDEIFSNYYYFLGIIKSLGKNQYLHNCNDSSNSNDSSNLDYLDDLDDLDDLKLLEINYKNVMDGLVY